MVRTGQTHGSYDPFDEERRTPEPAERGVRTDSVDQRRNPLRVSRAWAGSRSLCLFDLPVWIGLVPSLSEISGRVVGREDHFVTGFGQGRRRDQTPRPPVKVRRSVTVRRLLCESTVNCSLSPYKILRELTTYTKTNYVVFL